MTSQTQSRIDDSAALHEAFRRVRGTTQRLVEPLSAEDCAVQSMPDASPAKWHLAHTSWYFETFVLGNRDPHYEPFRSEFRYLFNSYYNGVGDQYPRPQRGLLTRPGLDEVLEYRAYVDAEMGALLEADVLSPALLEIAELGLHHEQQHQELLLTDLKHMFSHNPSGPVYRRTLDSPDPQPGKPLSWFRNPEGLQWIGYEGDGFSFDNERPRHRVFLHEFEFASRPVTNGEYLAFMADAGYERPELWLADGWAASRNWKAPLYWVPGEGGWERLTLAGIAPVRESAPVCHVSYYEADAYARWLGARLPTEAEWECAADGAPLAGNFLESDRLDPVPNAAADERPSQLYGDVWEWTQSAYSPYPGFVPPAGAVGEYNGKFMCNQFVLRGGSCVTSQDHIRPTYRNFFYPDARWQFSGIRLARDAS